MVIPSLNPEDSSDFSSNPSDPSDASGFEDSSEGFWRSSFWASWTADSELSFERWSTVSTWLLSVKGY